MPITREIEATRAVANQIATMNMEIKFFLHKFSKFRQKTNVIDNNLCHYLREIIDNIENYFHNDPEKFEGDINTEWDIDFEKQLLYRKFYCIECDLQIDDDRSKFLKRHIQEVVHKGFKSNDRINSKIEDTKKKTQLEIENELKLIKRQLRDVENKVVTPNDGINAKNEDMTNKGNKGGKPARRRRERRRKETKTDEVKENIAKKSEVPKKDRGERKKKEPEKQQLTKKVKSFIAGDFGKYLENSVKEANKLRNIPAYNEIKASLIACIKPVFEDVKIHFFGSRMNGLGNLDSDLDIFINIGNVYNDYEKDLVKGKALVKMVSVIELLKSENTEWQQFQQIRSARVPIIQVFNSKHRIDCDLSFTNGLAECNTLLMRHYFKIQPVVQKVCLFVKKWLDFTTLDKQYSTYALVLMVIFYFQQNKMLPSVAKLQKSVEPYLIGPWQANFVERSLSEFGLDLVPDNISTVTVLLIGFFEFCHKFDYDANVMSPFTGTIVQKAAFNSSSRQLERYHNYLILDPEKNGFQIDRVMCIQDPLEQNHNIAKGITAGVRKLFCQFAFCTAHELKAKHRK